MSFNNLKFLDFEVFANWWCCAVSDEESNYPGGIYNNQFTSETEKQIKDKMRIYTSDDPDAADKLKADFMHGILCGYNIKKYDLIIAKCIFNGFSPKKLKIANDILIRPELADLSPEYIRVASFLKFGWNGAEGWQDLLDDSDKSLKDKECSLGIDIRETTVPFDKVDLTEQDKKEIIFYNKHDVYALHVLYVTTSKAYIDTKIQLCQLYDIPIKAGYTNTNANLAGKVLGAERAHGTLANDVTITIRDTALANYFTKWLPAEIYNHLLTTKDSRTFEMFDNIVDIGDGGLHSIYKTPNMSATGRTYIASPLYIESTDDWTMLNVDVSSCYPSVMMFCGAMSRAITKPERFIGIYKKRLQLKLTPKSQWTAEDKVFVPAGKLVLNTTYGAMGNKYLNLYDDYMRTKVCRVGQIILLSICNNLYKTIPGLKVIQTNTDGVLVYARRSDADKIQQIVDEFSAMSNFVFEVEEDNKLWQLNVNNYIAVHPDGEVKNKGGAFITSIYQKGTNKLRPLGNYCIQKAQMAFYTDKTNPVKYLLDNTTVSDFCLTCTKGPTYSHMVQYNKSGEVQLGKVSRVIAVMNEEYGDIKKIGINKRQGPNFGKTKSDSVALCPPHPLVVDDSLSNYKIENRKLVNIATNKSWDIDYAYYARELDRALDIPWYKMKNDTFSLTKEFNL